MKSIIDAQPASPSVSSLTPTRTNRQMQASRRNGRKSNGPVTLVGKERSRQNAVSHGLFARVVQAGPLLVFGDRREYGPLVQKMQSEFGVRTSMGRALVESLVLDLLRLRQIRSMEVAIFDPGIDGDRDLETAIRDRERSCHRRSDEDNDALLQAYGAAAAQVRDGASIDVPPDVAPFMTEDLWRAMTVGRQYLESNRQDLKDLDGQIAAADSSEVAELQSVRAMTVESIVEDEADVRVWDREVFLITNEADLAGYVAGRKRIPPAQRDRWVALLERQRGILEQDLAQVRTADARINRYRRRHLVTAIGRTDDLNRLAEYEDRVRRSMAKTVALLKEVEGLSVIDV